MKLSERFAKTFEWFLKFTERFVKTFKRFMKFTERFVKTFERFMKFPIEFIFSREFSVVHGYLFGIYLTEETTVDRMGLWEIR